MNDTPTSTAASWPNAAKKLSNGNYLIADTGCARIIEVNAAGSIIWTYGNGPGWGPDQVDTPYFASRLSNGDTIITDYANRRIKQVSAAKEIIWQYGEWNVSMLSWPMFADMI